MATNTATSLPSMTLEHMSYTVSEVAKDGEHGDGPQADLDDRSSSLSDLGERAGHEEVDTILHGESDVNDTEAETERLEDSPPKQRKHQNVILASTNGMYNDHDSPLAVRTTEETRENGPPFDGDRVGQTSDISSLVDSGDEVSKTFSASPSPPRKRKRSSFEDDSLSDREPPKEPSPRLFTEISAHLNQNVSPEGSAEEDDNEVTIDTGVFQSANPQSRKEQQYVPPKQKYKKGKRKGKKTREDDTKNMTDATAGAGPFAEIRESHQAGYSNEEDMEVDDVGDVPETDTLVKTEEGAIQKKTALDSLHSMEKCFATLRDKIFDERFAQCNEELALLEQPVPTHSDFLAMKGVIDQRRDQKIEYEHTLMKNKLRTLQRESVANKAQIHSQYMQSVRELRDTALDRLNEEFYQLQRERRSCEGDVPEYMYNFTTKRSQQITQQMAYNSEVSILAGVAKHVGFPAAPDISKARPKEIEDDLRNMGIASGATNISQSHRPTLRTQLSGSAGFQRQRPAAEEHFLEQNAWANPQHPSHQQQRQQMHRQLSALSRAATPASTPAAQKRVIDLTEPQGSASTIAEAQSGPSSSMAPTPATGEASKVTQSDQYRVVGDKHIDSTPSKAMGVPIEATPAPLTASGPAPAMDKGKGAQPNRLDARQSPSLPRNKSQEAQTANAMPKPLPFMHTGSSSVTPGIRASTPGNYGGVKAEEAGRHARRSPMPHQYHAAASVSAVSSSHNRFAT